MAAKQSSSMLSSLTLAAMSAMVWAFVISMSSISFLAACAVVAVSWGLTASVSVVCWAAAWSIRAWFRAIICALNSSSNSTTTTSSLEAHVDSIPTSSLGLLAAAMPVPVLAPDAGADIQAMQAALSPCSPAKYMQAHEHPQQQETPPAATYISARSPSPQPIPEPAIPASPTVSLSLSPKPSVEVQQDDKAIAADQESGASQEQLTEAEGDTSEQQQQEEEQEEEEAMRGGDDNTILDLDDAPPGDTTLQVFCSEKQLIADMREWLTDYTLREQQGFDIMQQSYAELVGTQAALVATQAELGRKEADLVALRQQLGQAQQRAQHLQQQLNNQAVQLQDARAAQQAAELSAFITSMELTCTKDRLAEVERRSSSSGSSAASSSGLSQQSSGRSVSDDMSWYLASSSNRPWPAAGAVGAANGSSGACAVSASAEMD